MKKIIVIGSSNTDLIATVGKFPAAGETLEGNEFLQAMGGKGANQAVSARKSGADVHFICSVGNDLHGKNALEYYQKNGLDVSSALVVEGVASGIAVILVDAEGENCIVIIPGANNRLTSGYIEQLEEIIASGDIILLQMEIPYDTVKSVCRIAMKHQRRVMLNVAPARQVDKELLSMVDILVVNKSEAETITGLTILNSGETKVMEQLMSMGANTVILTLGIRGSRVKNREIDLFVPAFKVDAMDSTAAGDTFCGALAAEISRGSDWPTAMAYASAAAAISVTRMGAQPSIPTEAEVQEFLATNII